MPETPSQGPTWFARVGVAATESHTAGHPFGPAMSTGTAANLPNQVGPCDGTSGMSIF